MTLLATVACVLLVGLISPSTILRLLHLVGSIVGRWHLVATVRILRSLIPIELHEGLWTHLLHVVVGPIVVAAWSTHWPTLLHVHLLRWTSSLLLRLHLEVVVAVVAVVILILVHVVHVHIHVVVLIRWVVVAIVPKVVGPIIVHLHWRLIEVHEVIRLVHLIALLHVVATLNLLNVIVPVVVVVTILKVILFVWTAILLSIIELSFQIWALILRLLVIEVVAEVHEALILILNLLKIVLVVSLKIHIPIVVHIIAISIHSVHVSHDDSNINDTTR